jgi:TatD DNase family protein
MYVDSHAHLEGNKFDSDREQVIERARAAGLSAILCIGNADAPGQFNCALQLARQHDWMYATTGVHPHEARLLDNIVLAELEAIIQDPKVIAFGEIGLDYYYDHSPRDVQRQAFSRQMELARAAKLPVVIHCRPSDNSTNAWDDTLQMLRAEWAPAGLPGILHCFTGEWEHARAALDMGFYISFSGNVTFPKAEGIRAAASQVPMERLLIETDSPYLAPVPHRGKRNEPAFVVETARKLGELRSLSGEEMGEITRSNFLRLFSLDVKS